MIRRAAASSLLVAACREPAPPTPPDASPPVVVGAPRLDALAPAAWVARNAELTELRATAMAAHTAERWHEAVAAWRAALDAAPDHAGLRYNLACALTRAGLPDDALAELRTLVQMGVVLPIADDPDLAALHARPEWTELLAQYGAASRPGGAPHRVVPVELPEFFAEGIAVAGDAMWLGGIVAQSIVRIGPRGPADFATTDGRWSVFGLAHDRARDRVWAAASAAPQGRVLPTATAAAGLFAFATADGAPHERWVLDDDASHLFGDLAIAGDGVVYATDTLGGGVYAAVPGEPALRTVVPPGTFASPQGIVAFADDTLVVADYAAGLVAVALDDRGAAKTLRSLPPPAGTTLRGVDGLARRGTTLAAVRNGVVPWAVLRVELSADATSIREVVPWVVVDPAAGEPTLATDGGDAVYVIQTDRWDRVFDREGRPRDGVAIASPTVLAIPWPRG